MPLRHDVEHLPEAQLLGEVGQVLGVAMSQLNDEINGLSLLVPPGVPTPGRIRLRQAVKPMVRPSAGEPIST